MAGKGDDAAIVVPPAGDVAGASAVSTVVSTSNSTSTSTRRSFPPSAKLGVLPTTVTCTFAAEGSANAVFQMRPGGVAAASTAASAAPVSTTMLHPSIITSHLLRVPKAAPGVSPHVCIDHHDYYVSVLQPLIGPDYLVGQRLVCGVTQLHPHLNRLLAAHDDDPHRRRRPDWAGCLVADNVDVALLVEDMTAATAATATIQFKPKWLAQSPTAPSGARRCRTCALSAALASKGPGKTSRTPKPCPLVLVAEEQALRANGTAKAADRLDDALWDYLSRHLGPNDPASALLPAARAAIVRWVRTTDLFRRLAVIQREYDPKGALCIRPGDDGAAAAQALDRLQTAMTLRDCTCYLRVSLHVDGRVSAVSAKLGDLDRKDGRRRLARWQAQERELIDGGFYTAAEEPRQATQCWLER
ncbi:hypothetical protein CMQ_5746 [Grosmannia clavigera kw1407]|uniref:Inositol-pentakisphosphate 2-kinase n=1 Tax=Grosmannia clavigera (strain kw1407 / UAMH 11150) TaxID=655863 RepID=F0XSI5_GROCL|nr:uncharacterized protein CMQ_5746 [Grosmannia clavigera kw1407]EFW99325.1 hypothetical protein CMQ_5746 [Grosmannia clavigera kw1407]